MSIRVRPITCPLLHKFFRALHTWKNTKMATECSLPCRENPVIKKLDTPEFHAMFTPELNALSDLFKKRNYEIRIAGGAVRDLLMGMKPKDLDFATTATPDQMKEMFEEEEVRIINTKGEKHGTITPRINDKENFEVTTLRIDTVTNGRHAQVEFTTDWKLDANRRDLTINSMFLDLEGTLYDYFYGYEDLEQRRIAFVGEPATRIQEDYLRILRYFRFYGRIAEKPDEHEEETIKAIKDNVAGLEGISGERIWSEWSKILAGRYAKELTLRMLDCGIIRYVGLPESPDIKTFQEVFERAEKNNLQLKPITLLTCLLKGEEEVMKIYSRLKFSGFERNLALFLVKYRNDILGPDTMKSYRKVVIHSIGKRADLINFVCELFRYKGRPDLAEDFEKAGIPKFPVSGFKLTGFTTKGTKIGVITKKLKDIWIENDFQITGDDLLKEVPRILSELEDGYK